jgi:DNA repair exonuclease SbcCD ATPase subunit
MSLEDELDQKIAHTQQQLEEITASLRNLLDIERMFQDTSKELSGAASSLSALSAKVNETVGLMQGALQSFQEVTSVIRSSDPGKITAALNGLGDQMQKITQDLQVSLVESKKSINAILEGVTVNDQSIAVLSQKSDTFHNELKENISEHTNTIQKALQAFASKRFNILMVIIIINLLIAIGTLIRLFM